MQPRIHPFDSGLITWCTLQAFILSAYIVVALFLLTLTLDATPNDTPCPPYYLKPGTGGVPDQT